MFHVKRRAMAESPPLTRKDVRAAFETTAADLKLPELGLNVSDAAVDRISGLCAALLSSRTQRLTSYDSLLGVLQGLVLPALAALRWLEAERTLDVLEIGAGSGGLGLALAVLAPNWSVSLVDRRQKAVSFIEVAIVRLKLLNASAVLADASNAGDRAASYDAALLRAVGSPDDDLALAAPWLKRGGTCLIWTSARSLVPSESSTWSQLGSTPCNQGRATVLAYRKV